MAEISELGDKGIKKNHIKYIEELRGIISFSLSMSQIMHGTQLY